MSVDSNAEELVPIVGRFCSTVRVGGCLRLPEEWLEACFGNSEYAYLMPSRCAEPGIDIYPATIFDRELERIKRATDNANVNAELEIIGTAVTKVKIDENGCVEIPLALLDHAGIADDVDSVDLIGAIRKVVVRKRSEQENMDDVMTDLFVN